MSRTDATLIAILVGLLLVLGLIMSGQADEWASRWVALYTVAQQEPPSPGHEGQPSHCSNATTVPKAHKCECKKTPGEDGSGCDTEDKACKVYCRKHHCHCFHPLCDS